MPCGLQADNMADIISAIDNMSRESGRLRRKVLLAHNCCQTEDARKICLGLVEQANKIEALLDSEEMTRLYGEIEDEVERKIGHDGIQSKR